MPPKVSVVIPVFNGGDYFALAVESALAQSYGNIEIIVVNDGSRDDGHTELVASTFGDKIRYYRQENEGVAGALNTAISHMTGDYFNWLSHDDLFEPEKVDRQVAYLAELGKADACLFSDFRLIDAQGTVTLDVQLDHDELTRHPLLPLYQGLISGCTIMIPRQVLGQIGPFDRRYRNTQDYRLWHRLVHDFELFHQPEILVRSRQHAGQDSARPDAIVETESLWHDLVAELNETRRVQLHGSSERFLRKTARMLSYTSNRMASKAAAREATACRDAMLVSIVIGVEGNERDLATAIASAGLQTHGRVEILVLRRALEAVVPSFAGVPHEMRIISVGDATEAEAWNIGLDAARGSYIALLRRGDAFTPQKVEVQLAAMLELGSLSCHTSYVATTDLPDAPPGIVPSGRFGGAVYPRILSNCPISLSTVMIHRLICAEGFCFEASIPHGWQMLAWIWAAARHDLLGVDQSLSVVRLDSAQAPLHLDDSVKIGNYLLDYLTLHPVYERQTVELEDLRTEVQRLERELRGYGRSGLTDLPKIDRGLSSHIFGLPA